MTTSTLTPAGIIHHDDAGEYLPAYAIALDNGSRVVEVSDMTDAELALVIRHIETHDADLTDRCREWAADRHDGTPRDFLRVFAGRFEEMADGEHFEIP